MSTLEQRAVFKARTKELVDLLLAERAGREAAARIQIRAARIQIRALFPGVLAVADVPSVSDDSKTYVMFQSLSGRWFHTDTRCRGWVERGSCHHVTDLEGDTKVNKETAALVIQSNPLSLIGEVTTADVLKRLQPVGEWRYSFRRKGQEIEGISADGVRDGIREMARQGEAIRTLEVRLEKDDENEAYFIARAARFAIAADGSEVLLDTTIRGKRISKLEARADGNGTYFNDAWFEHGVTKASRNAEEALMPEALKQWMLAEAKKLAPAQAGRLAAPPQRQATRPANVDKDGVIEGQPPAQKPPVAAQAARQPAQVAKPVCEPGKHGDQFFDDAGVLRCGICKGALEGPDAVPHAQPSMLAQ